MISVTRHIAELNDRMDAAILLMDETHSAPSTGRLPGPAAREARGLVIVTLFAAYENLLRSLTRTLLEGAIRCGVSTKRLQPGIMTFALIDSTTAARDRSSKRLYSDSLPAIINAFHADRRSSSIDSNAFPDDGTFMKSTQVQLWCRLFGIAPPASILRRIWASLDAVVAQRNEVAHGARTASEVGRRYTEAEMRDLIDDWRHDWTAFLSLVGIRASTRDFFRVR
jgi:RiboL-PSP-HEPN